MTHEAVPVGPRVLGLLGAGASAREIASYLPTTRVAFRAVHHEFMAGAPPETIDIGSPTPDQAATPVVATPGAPGARRAMVASWPGSRYATVVSAAAHVGEPSGLGAGSVVAPGVVLTTDVRCGSHVHVNVGATVSHDCDLGDFATLAPGVHLAGGVQIGDGAFVGIGAVVSQGVRVAPGVVVGAGAVVLDDVPTAHAVVVGVPARVASLRQDWLHEL